MIALISDTHIGVKQFNKTVFQYQMEYFEKEFFPYLLRHKIKTVIHLGDLVENRVVTDNWIDGQFKKRFFKWFDRHAIHLVCLVGNHDSYYKNTIEHNYQRANLKEFEYTTVIDESRVYSLDKHKIGFVPWLTQYHQIEEMPKPSEVDFLIGHFAIAGALMQGNQYSRAGFSYDLFNEYKLVLSGHFHATSQKNNFRYIGSQYQMKWSDYGNEKGFWLIDDNLEMKFIKNKKSPKFLKLFYLERKDGIIILKLGGLSEKLKDVTLEEAINYSKYNYIKVIVKQYNNQDLLERCFERISRGALDKVEIINESSIIEDFDIDKFEEDIKDNIDLFSTIKTFAVNSQYSFDINKDILIDKLEKLYQDAQQERRL